MSSVHEIRCRLLFEQLEQWVKKLSGEERVAPDAAQELTVRLLAMAVMLLKQHGAKRRRRCRCCACRRWNWRFWKKRPQCTVCSVLDFVMGQELAVVWWRLFGSMGRRASWRRCEGDLSVASARAQEPCNTARRSAATAGSVDNLSRSSAGVTVTSVRPVATTGYPTCACRPSLPGLKSRQSVPHRDSAIPTRADGRRGRRR